MGSLVLVVTLPLLACSPSAPSAPSSAPTPAAPTDSAAATAPASGSPESSSPSPTTLATLAASDCLTGPYRLVRFAQLGGTATYGIGQGGMSTSFTGKHYALRGGGQDPIALTLAGRTADLTIDGTAKGTFDLLGDRATFDPVPRPGWRCSRAAASGKS